MIEKFFDFMRDAGKYALDMQQSIDFIGGRLKSERVHDVVTQIELRLGRSLKNFA